VRTTPMAGCVKRFASAALVLLLPGHLHAQDATTSFEDLRHVVNVGDTIVVTDAKGQVIRGQLRRILEDSIDIHVPPSAEQRHPLASARQFSRDELSRIEVERRDPLWNGALIGAAVGASPFLTFAALRATGSDPPEKADVIAGGVIFGALGALVGSLTDSAIVARRVVFAKQVDDSSHIRISLYVSTATMVGRVHIRLK
jgi:hypothetical protein